MPSASHKLLGDTDPRDHGPGWRYVVVPLSSRGTKLSTLVGPDTRIARAVPPDPFTVNPTASASASRGVADRDQQLSHKPNWARVAEIGAESGSPVMLITSEDIRQYQPAKPQPERGGRAG